MEDKTSNKSVTILIWIFAIVLVGVSYFLGYHNGKNSINTTPRTTVLTKMNNTCSNVIIASNGEKFNVKLEEKDKNVSLKIFDSNNKTFYFTNLADNVNVSCDKYVYSISNVTDDDTTYGYYLLSVSNDKRGIKEIISKNVTTNDYNSLIDINTIGKFQNADGTNYNNYNLIQNGVDFYVTSSDSLLSQKSGLTFDNITHLQIILANNSYVFTKLEVDPNIKLIN